MINYQNEGIYGLSEPTRIKIKKKLPSCAKMFTYQVVHVIWGPRVCIQVDESYCAKRLLPFPSDINDEIVTSV